MRFLHALFYQKARNSEYEKWIKEFIAKFNYEEMSNIKIIL